MKKNIGISILGLGKSGVAAANLAIKLGYNVFASDIKKNNIIGLDKKIVVEFGKHSDKILNSDLIVKSPGIRSDVAILKKAYKHKIRVISELAFSLENSKYKKIIAITGTNGKTTTTDLISRIVKVVYKDSTVSGNIGYPLSNIALKTTKNTIIIMEVSSYQLEDTPEFRPDVSVLLNITSDHIEHHKTIKAYIRAKENILINQRFGSVAIINYDNEICKKIALRLKTNKFCPKISFFSRKPLEDGVFYNNGKIIISIRGERIKISPKINILGQHNIENILAATSVSYSMGIAPIVIEKIISKYKGVEHRIEFVRTLNGVNYYNDSKSTNVDSTRVALESFDKNILIIMGGRDKGVSYTSLKELVKHKVKSIFLIGEASNKIKKDLRDVTTFFDCNNIENAIRQIVEVAAVGDIALLSPACASFDQFNDFEERGDVFKKIVNNLG